MKIIKNNNKMNLKNQRFPSVVNKLLLFFDTCKHLSDFFFHITKKLNNFFKRKLKICRARTKGIGNGRGIWGFTLLRDEIRFC